MTKAEARDLAAALWRVRDLVAAGELNAPPTFVRRVEGAALLAEVMGQPGRADPAAVVSRLKGA